MVGLQCGGSDGNSGVTANPALGVAADLLVAQGGTAILAETPEIYGAEHLLTRRAVSRGGRREAGRADQVVGVVPGVFGAEINNNPSPGQQGRRPDDDLREVARRHRQGRHTPTWSTSYEYAEPVTATGFVFMDTPGYDPVSATGQVAGGANLICFTTGRGSVFGCKPSPSIKIATNTPLYEHMEDDMDINCGVILDGDGASRRWASTSSS